MAPKALTAGLVTRPAKSSATPKARAMGHAVGAGNSTLASALVLCGFTSCFKTISYPLAGCSFDHRFSLPSDDIHRGEHHHPDDVDKMPVERQHIDVLGVLLLHSAGQSQDHHHTEPHQTRRHVEGMQPDERIVGRAERLVEIVSPSS